MPVLDVQQRRALLALTLVPGLGPALTRRCLDRLGSPAAVLEAGVSQLRMIEGIGPHRAQEIARGIEEIQHSDALAREEEMIAQMQVTLLCLGEDDYPALLQHIIDPPPLLYVQGRLQRQDALSLAIVGSRQCSLYGREQADRLSSLCAQAGLCIVSGGAAGIDAAAHRAALRAGGRTVAVLGSGLARPYPPQHKELFDQIAQQGAVVSELPMTMGPLAENFPRRNRIISGLSLGVLVVEAAVRSGALITARLAVEEHHREVMALPGRVDSPGSAGCHKIIREGWATLVTSAADVLDCLGEAGQMLKGALREEAPGSGADQPQVNLWQQNLSPAQSSILQALGQPLGLDQLLAATSLPVGSLQAELTVLQIRGLIAHEAGRYHSRRPAGA